MLPPGKIFFKNNVDLEQLVSKKPADKDPLFYSVLKIQI